MANPVAMNLILSISPTRFVTNLFDILFDYSSSLKHIVGSFREPRGTMCVEHRIFVPEAWTSLHPCPTVLACTLVKRDEQSFLATLADVSKQVEQEQRLRQSFALLSSVIEVVPGLIYVKDRAGRLLLANKATLALLDRPWSEIEGKRQQDIGGPFRLSETLMADDDRVVALNAPREREVIIDHPDLGRRVYLSTKVPFGEPDDQLSGMVSLSIDITERKALDNELLHLSRRTAMGDMAAAIAHEINQPLAAISLYLGAGSALLAKEPSASLLAEPIARATDQCLRAGEIIRRVRFFVSSGDQERHVENLRLVVEEACAMACFVTNERGVATTIEHDREELLAMVDKVQIEQVIVNLIRNAFDAMIEVPDPALRVTIGRDAGGMAIISVSDNGPGIDDAVFEGLFKPFVSTKGRQGLGIGLSVCQSVIESHGGKIWAEPRSGRGAKFSFTLPILVLEGVPE